jgi:hypothetical protein
MKPSKEREDNIKINFSEIGCGDERWNELARDDVQ